MNQKGFSKNIGRVAAILLMSIVGFFFFLIYTGSAAFTKKDAEALNNFSKQIGQTKERFQKLCEGMSALSYAEHHDMYITRTFYYKSQCYQRLASQYTDPAFCEKVVERQYTGSNTGGISKNNCLKQVREKEKLFGNFDQNATDFANLKATELKITETNVKKLTEGQWEITVKIIGSLPGQYKIEFVNISPRNPVSLALQETPLKAGEQTLRWVISQAQLDQSLNGTKRRFHSISVELTLMSTNSSPETINHLTSIGSVVIDTGQ